ncbi:SAF domain-containing protein [Brevibacillus fulvus]|uniref:Flagellar biosynthesis protein FlgA n=1 Tax=Brevibacillus fulvus TaxID=1125967 RepID=A0A938Y4T1_9BACL|nr:SAF domain-containing protein [Brevibacillus fulvus]MBM7592304.1 hypothetical protein [Brevibacillus fulvus]
MKKQTLIAISSISLVLALICFFAATQYIDSLVEEKLFAPVVKVANGKEIQPYEPITRDDVVLVLEETDEIMDGSFQTIESVLGKQSIQTIFSGEQLLAQKLQDNYLLPKKNEARYEFPINSLMPITELRKGDFVKIWVRYKPRDELIDVPPPMHFSITDAAADFLFESQLVTVKDTNGIEIYTLKPNLIPNAEELGNPLFHGSKAKNLVDSERRYHDYRSQPSSVPAYVGFNLTDEQYRILTEAMRYGTIQIGHVLRTAMGGNKD